MKKTIIISLIFMLLQACYKEEFPIPYGNVAIQVNFEDGFSDFSKENIKVILLEQDGNILKEGYTNNKGIVLFKNILNDNYQVKIKHTFNKDIVFKKIGLHKNIHFIGGSNKINVSAFKTAKQKLILKTNKVGSFVIKQVYNSNAGGGRDLGGYYEYIRFNDGFFEIYNNSPKTLYADGLQIGITSNSYEKQWYKDNENCYLEQVFTIKGTGKEYPVLPGKTILIAATAINHISANGLTKKQKEGLYLFGEVPKSVDLSAANFETYFDGFATNYDIDMANTPNLEVSFNTEAHVKEMAITNRGISLVIFKNTNINNLKKVAIVRGKYTKRTYQYLKLPNNKIIDAFEAQAKQNFNSNVISENVNVLQAWEGKSYHRKTSTIVNGRKILLDTDNCSTDFTILTQAKPSSFLKN